jgi:pilus assembly protein CpaB
MPRGRNPLVLILALVSGAAAFMLSLQMTKAPAAKNTAAPSSTKVVVHAVNDISIGSIIKKSDIDLLPPSGSYNPKMVYENIPDVMGRVVRRNVLKGEIVKKLDILADGDNLAALIPKGYRAMTIPVMLPSSITELLQIGNRVDVILTYDVSKGDINSLTLVENARVIGVSKQGGEGGSGGTKKMDITLAVTPEGAETLAFSIKRGTLNLSIRSLDEDDNEKFFTLKELFFPQDKESKIDPNQLLEAEVPKVPKDLIEIIRGVRKEQYATSVQ